MTALERKGVWEGTVFIDHVQDHDSVSSLVQGWEAVDRLIHDLPRCHERQAASRRFLFAVHEALHADTVYQCSPGGAEGRAIPVVGRPVCPTWAADLLRLALAGAPGVENQLLVSRWQPSAQLSPPQPAALAAVRLSRSRDLWAVAVRFRPEPRFAPADMTLLMLCRQMLLNAWQQQQMQGQLRQTVLGLVEGFTNMVDGRDRYMAGHSERVARIAVRLGQQLHLPPADLGDLYLAALLHNIGSVRLDEAILQKPGILTPEEMELVKRHPILGASIVARVAPIAHLAPIVRSHHERFDGQGYPDGLTGDNIPLLARILAVADSFDALANHRPYRPASNLQQIETIFTAGAGSQWDEQIVRCLLCCLDDVYLLAQTEARAAGADEPSAW